MKVQVKDEQGRAVNPYPKIFNIFGNKSEVVNLNWTEFEQSVKTYPAPGIADGTHECELKWQVIELSYGKWRDVKPIENVDNLISLGRTVSLNWILAEQEKEGDKSLESAKEALRPHLHGFSDEQFNEEIRHFPLSEVLFAMERYADIKSTRIAELEARVAELEAVLKEICNLNWEEGSDLQIVTKMYDIATNAIKNKIKY